MAEAIDYKALGLKVGLEIHRQLDTRKLFCGCPSVLRDEAPHFTVTRFLHPVAGETGEIDIAAQYEKKRGMHYIYEAYNDTTCLVELDEAPPQPLNAEALDIALEIALLLNSRIVDEVQVMRKTVLDGSNTSGFQRTALVATGGFVEMQSGKIGIQTISLEEDAARIMGQGNKSVTYRLDRLGIPLIEIATAPEINSPQQAREVAEIIGNLLKATGKVKTGIGTIRQDLNLSIKGGARIEIKGVQELNILPLVVEKEVQRQLDIIKGGKKVEPEVRKVEDDGSTSFLRPMPGAARMYPETDLRYIKIDLARVAAIKKILPEPPLKKHERLLKMGLGKELADQIIRSDYLLWFEKLAGKFKTLEPKEIAAILVNTLPDIQSREGLDISKITIEHIGQVLALIQAKKIAREGVPLILGELAKMPQKSALQIAREKKLEGVSEKEATEIIRKIIARERTDKINVIVGEAMKELRGRLDGAKIAEIVRQELKK